MEVHFPSVQRRLLIPGEVLDLIFQDPKIVELKMVRLVTQACVLPASRYLYRSVLFGFVP